MYVSTVQNANIQNSLNCLLTYKVKKTDEVKIKKQKKAKTQEQTTINQQPTE